MDPSRDLSGARMVFLLPREETLTISIIPEAIILRGRNLVLYYVRAELTSLKEKVNRERKKRRKKREKKGEREKTRRKRERREERREKGRLSIDMKEEGERV